MNNKYTNIYNACFNGLIQNANTMNIPLDKASFNLGVHFALEIIVNGLEMTNDLDEINNILSSLKRWEHDFPNTHMKES